MTAKEIQNKNNMSDLDPSEQRILDAIGKTNADNKERDEKFSELDKEAKALEEKFGEVTRNWEGLSSDVKELTRTMSNIESKKANERRSNGQSAMERISGDPELRNAINGMVRASHGLAKGQSLSDMPTEWSDPYQKMQDSIKGKAAGDFPSTTYVDDHLIPEVFSLIAEYGIWSQFDVIPASTSSEKLIVDSTDPLMLVTAPGVVATEASYTGANVTATIKKILGWIGIPRESLEDSEVDISSLLLRKFANATAYRLDYFALASDGTDDATNGNFEGIYTSGTAAVAASGNVSIATLDSNDFVTAMAAVAPSILTKPGARWWVHPTSLVKMLNIKDGNGRPIFLSSVDAPSHGGLGSILGYPVTPAHAGISADTTSTVVAVFGDPMANAVVLRKDFEFASSDQAQFTEDQIVFRARARGASVIKQATGFAELTTAAS